MSEPAAAGRPAPPKLPWLGTVALLAMVVVVALVRPFVPHGIVEAARRLVGLPLALEIGSGRSVRLIEEPAIKTDCQVLHVRWSPDGTVLVIECPAGLQAWTPDGRRIDGVTVDNGWPQRHMQVLGNPFRVVYLARAGARGVNQAALMTWDVQHDGTSAESVPPNAISNFAVDPEHARVAVTDPRQRDIKLLSLDGGALMQTLPVPSGVASMRWVSAAQALLLGSYDGVLRRADVATGGVRELARPYTTSFPAGGGANGSIEGLVPAPDGKSVAIFMSGGGIYPAPGSNTIDQEAARQWREELGTTVEIRSLDDGRLLERMPGPDAGAVDAAWDPRDRFIAIAGRDALFLWARRDDAQAIMTFDDPGTLHSLAITPDGGRLALTTRGGVRIFRIEEQGLRSS
jgi:hypothetical protein